MRARDLSVLLRIVKGMSPMALVVLSEMTDRDSFLDEAIRAVARGEMEWRAECQTN